MSYDPRADKWLRKQPRTLRARIFSKLSESKTNPYHFFDKLTNSDYWKLRVGDYRVIADLEHNTIKVLLIDHRENVYEE